MEHRGKCILASSFFSCFVFWNSLQLRRRVGRTAGTEQLKLREAAVWACLSCLKISDWAWFQFKTVSDWKLSASSSVLWVEFLRRAKLLKSGDFEPALRLRGEFPKSWDGLQGTWKAWARVDNPFRFQFRTCSIQKPFNWENFRTSWFQF